MTLPDDQFLALTEGSEQINLDSLFNGEVSGTFTGPLEILEGVANKLSLTLVPMWNSAYLVNFSGTTTDHRWAGSSTGMARKFLVLESLSFPSDATSITLTCTATWTAGSTPASVLLGQMALYADDGTLLKAQTIGDTLSSGDSVAFEYDYPVDCTSDPLYLYVEYDGPVTLNFTSDVVLPTNTEAVAVLTEASAWNDGVVYFRLLDSSSDIVAVGFMPIAGGAGSGTMLDPVYLTDQAQITPVRLTFDTAYTFEAFYDHDGDALSTGLEPDGGDICLPSKAVTITDTTPEIETVALLPAQFTYTMPDLSAGPLSVNLPAASYPTAAGKRFFFALYDGITIDDAVSAAGGSANVDWSAIGPVAYGIAQLDSSGAGSTTPVSATDGQAFALAGSTKYYISGFIDTNDAYASITDISSAMDDVLMQPLTGDYCTVETLESTQGKMAVTSDSAGALALSGTSFVQNTSKMYFISASGTGSGLSPTAPFSWTSAVAAYNTAVTANPDAQVSFFLTGDLTLSVPMTVSGELVLSSWAASPYTLALSGTPASPFFTVSGNGTLVLTNLTVTDSAQALTDSPFMVYDANVTNHPSLILYKDSTIENMTVTGKNGGAVTVGSGALMMMGGSIIGCSAEMGGAVFVGPGSSLYWESGSVTGNSASVVGGGIYVAAGGNFTDATATSGTSVTGNYANSIESNIVQVPTGSVTVTLTLSDLADPDLTLVTAASVLRADTVTIDAPSGYTAYEWQLNGVTISGKTSASCSFVPATVSSVDGAPIQTGANTVTLIVTDATGISSKPIEFTITD